MYLRVMSILLLAATAVAAKPAPAGALEAAVANADGSKDVDRAQALLALLGFPPKTSVMPASVTVGITVTGGEFDRDDPDESLVVVTTRVPATARTPARLAKFVALVDRRKGRRAKVVYRRVMTQRVVDSAFDTIEVNTIAAQSETVLDVVMEQRWTTGSKPRRRIHDEIRFVTIQRGRPETVLDYRQDVAATDEPGAAFGPATALFQIGLLDVPGHMPLLTPDGTVCGGFGFDPRRFKFVLHRSKKCVY